jgi:oligopeptide/dipeptide ABC transporter ATP-binding protein
MTIALVETQGLSKHYYSGEGFFGRGRRVAALNEVSLSVFPGETLGLVGESGCGKTTFGRTLLRLVEPTAGRILFSGQDVTHLSDRDLIPLRRRMQIVFQDPFSSLDPRMTVTNLVGEPLRIHGLVKNRKEERERVSELLASVGLGDDALDRYPHEFSGGQRQRIGVARALAVSPDFIVCDEPLSALDVSIQAQIVNLLLDLRERLGVAYLFISHDLELVRYMSHRIAVMYLGHVVELGPTEVVTTTPAHPYTRALMASIPVPDPKRRQSPAVLKGDVPSPLNPPSGCPFHPRCPRAIPGRCDATLPPLESTRHNPRHSVRCISPHDRQI